MCTLQNKSKVPASRELGLECTPQQHTKCAQGGGKETRLLLGVANYKECTNQKVSSISRHACIKTRLLLGVPKNKESKT